MLAKIATSALSADLYIAENQTLADRYRINRPKVVDTPNPCGSARSAPKETPLAPHAVGVNGVINSASLLRGLSTRSLIVHRLIHARRFQPRIRGRLDLAPRAIRPNAPQQSTHPAHRAVGARV